ncbi:hypothetical protein UlMin_041989 [Ulmus minor]
MGFWGIEVKPGKAYPYHSDNVRGRLHVTQATLGLGSSKERSIVQCSIGHKSPIFLCSLLPNKNESCPLNLEYEDGDDLVAFSVIGERSVHLSGYFESDEGDEIRDDYDLDPFGEDIADTESDSSEYNSSDDYDDDDLDMYSPPSSPVPNSGVVIEEIVDDEKKPAHGNGQSKRSKKNQSNGSEDKTNSQHQIVVRGDISVPVLQSEDEDGFPISNKQKGKSNVIKPDAEMKPTDDKTTEKSKKKKAQDGDNAANLKRKVENVGQEDRQEKQKKKMKKKQLMEQVQDESAEELANEKNHNVEMDLASHDNQSEEEEKKKKKKKKKKNKKKQEIEGGTNADQAASAQENQRVSTLDSEPEAKSSKVRTFANGLVIEDIAMGKPDGKRASPGKTISVRYTGKLQKNGKIFDSNVGRAPFKFRLGLGQVISGWDVGVNGMRVGDKRKLTIPPAMGYGHKGAGGVIPPNAWLVFDVELIDVR